MNIPLVSVITCTKNSEKYLKLNLDSVRAQTYPNFEHVFIDGFSTDKTVGIIKDYISSNPQIKTFFYQFPPKGIANAMNLGAAHSQGSIIHFLHGDDYYLDPNSLLNAVQIFIDEPDTQWALADTTVVINSKEYIIKVAKVFEKFPKLLWSFNFINQENSLVTRDFLKRYGPMEERNKCAVEYPMWLRAIKETRPKILEKSFTAFIVHEGSTSSNIKNLPRNLYENLVTSKVFVAAEELNGSRLLTKVAQKSKNSR